MLIESLGVQTRFFNWYQSIGTLSLSIPECDPQPLF